ncbi:MAG TPA: LLM class flavin-dependent oxidoreductase [Thermomicrobiales bacterium]|nr:LLM class flavin-dependent oxidoreductase [Thermomicrobiales bacterium]
MMPTIGVMFRREQHPASLAGYARRAEALGFDQIWVVEDCFYLGGVAQAAIALAATTRIGVGLGIAPAVARNPAFLAMEYATLASAFPERFIGGIGHGFGGWMEQVGAKPASWLRSMEAITTAVRRILHGEEVTVEGTYAHLDRVQLEAPPEVVPPIVLGVQAEKSLRLAGACADGVLLAEGSGPDYVRWARGLMEQGRNDAGREGRGSVTVYAHCLVDDRNPGAARDQMRDIVARSVAGFVQPQVWQASFGPALAELAVQGGAEAVRAGMPDAWLDDLAITGTSDDARAAIRRLAEAGADSVVLVPPAGVDADAWLDGPFMHAIARGSA